MGNRLKGTGTGSKVGGRGHRLRGVSGWPSFAAVGSFAENAVRAEYDGLCFGFVMMPEHVHALVRFRETDQLSLFKQEWKRCSSISLFDYFEQAGNPIVEHLIREDGTHRIWTPKQYDFNVFTHEKAWEKLQYMHDNPVKRGLATTPEEWAFSSARWYSNRRSVGVTLMHIDE